MLRQYGVRARAVAARRAVYERPAGRHDRIRAAPIEPLRFLDNDPVTGRLTAVERLGRGTQITRARVVAGVPFSFWSGLFGRQTLILTLKERRPGKLSTSVPLRFTPSTDKQCKILRKTLHMALG